MQKSDMRSLTYQDWEREMKQLGEPAYRAGQIFSWLHEKQAASLEEMTNLSKKIKEYLEEHYCLTSLSLVEVQKSKQDDTRKYLFSLEDGNVIESVRMKYRHGNSVCISSQVGCKMGCRFCASTLDGWLRNLTAGEMLEQIYAIQRDIGERVSNVVVMGTGEPLDNLSELVKFIGILSHEKGLQISQRNITVSTCGLVPEIYALAEEKLQITLALSLHASNQEKREQLMPIARQYSLDQVMKACKYYIEKTGRRMTFEYALVAGVNDSAEDAGELGKLLSGMLCHLNLIPVNPIKERDFKQPDRGAVLAFQNKLEKCRINVTIRREMGRDIDGACGQLRKKHMEGQV